MSNSMSYTKYFHLSVWKLTTVFVTVLSVFV